MVEGTPQGAGISPLLLFALPASWAAMPFRRVHEIDPVWVHSPADVELASIIQPMADRHPHSNVQVFDLRTLPHGIEFIGLRCSCRTFLIFATCVHPKRALLDLSHVLSSYGIEPCSQAFEHFEIPQPRVQAVTIQHQYYRYLFREKELISVRDGNIIEFEENRVWKARPIMRALRTRDGYAICSYCFCSFPTEGSAAQAGGKCPKCKAQLEFSDVAHDFAGGICRRCGCSAGAVFRFGWECK